MNKKTIKTMAETSSRAAFTLVELLVVVAIIGILATGAVIGVPRILESSRKTAARSQLQTLRTAIDQYQMETRKYPDSLNALIEGENPLIEGGEDALLDPWGMDYIYVKQSRKNFDLRSCGPDQEPNTNDDIIAGNSKK